MKMKYFIASAFAVVSFGYVFSAALAGSYGAGLAVETGSGVDLSGDFGAPAGKEIASECAVDIYYVVDGVVKVDGITMKPEIIRLTFKDSKAFLALIEPILEKYSTLRFKADYNKPMVSSFSKAQTPKCSTFAELREILGDRGLPHTLAITIVLKDYAEVDRRSAEDSAVLGVAR